MLSYEAVEKSLNEMDDEALENIMDHEALENMMHNVVEERREDTIMNNMIGGDLPTPNYSQGASSNNLAVAHPQPFLAAGDSLSSSAMALSTSDQLAASRAGNKRSRPSTRSPEEGVDYVADATRPQFIISRPKDELCQPTPEEVIMDAFQKLLHTDPSVSSRGSLLVKMPPQSDAFYYNKQLPKWTEKEPLTSIKPNGPQSGTLWWIGDREEEGVLQVTCTLSKDVPKKDQHRVLRFTLVRRPSTSPAPIGNKEFNGPTVFNGVTHFNGDTYFKSGPIIRGADYAEYFLLANPEEDACAGEVVEALGGVISKKITNSSGARYFVISHKPSLCGNYPESAEDQKRMRRVALLGLVRVFVQGEVEDNALLVPAGEGLARALTPAEVEDDPSVASRCFGVVWMHAKAPSEDKDNKSVIAFVSSGESGACSLAMATLAKRLFALERLLSALFQPSEAEAASDASSSTLQPLIASVLRGTCERMASTWPPDWLSQLPQGSGQHSLAGTLLVLLGWVSQVDEAIEEPAADNRGRETVDSIQMKELADLFQRLGEDNKGYTSRLALRALQLPAEKVNDLATEAMQKAKDDERDPQGKTHSAGRWFDHLLERSIKQIQAEDSSINPTLPAAPPPSRDYQEELFEKAKDRDVILVTPPGTGKTHVSAKVIEYVLKRCEGKVCVYFEKNRNLVQQQKKELDKYFRQTFEGWNEDFVGAYVGGDFMPQWKELRTLHRVLLLTPQLLVDRLDRGKARLGDVALLVFDECHDAKGDHAYNKVMQHYMGEREGGAADGLNLPQILGLSATPANADTVESTHMKLDALSSNMGGAKIIQVTEHSDSLEKYVCAPEVTPHSLKAREDDITFRAELRKLMSKIARSFANEFGVDSDEVKAAMRTVVKRLESAGIHTDSPEELDFGAASGTTMRDAIAKLRDDDGVTAHNRLARNRVAFELLGSLAAAELTVLELGWEIALMDVGVGVARALDVASDPSETQERPVCLELTKFVLDSGICADRYIKSLLAAQPSGVAPSNTNSASASMSPRTPKLQQLEKCLKEYWEESRSLSCIVFVKERRSAYRLVSYLLKQPTLRFVKPSVFIGRKSMSTKAQDAVRTKFLRAEVNLLVATSVAEEGLNATECSMAVMMDSVFTGQALTQCMGRVRKLSGKFHVFYYRTERTYFLRSEQQQEAASDALRERAERPHATVEVVDPLGKLNQMKQQGRLSESPCWNEYETMDGMQKVFVVTVTFKVHDVAYRGEGRGLKKIAQKEAARKALLEFYTSSL